MPLSFEHTYSNSQLIKQGLAKYRRVEEAKKRRSKQIGATVDKLMRKVDKYERERRKSSQSQTEQ